MIKINIRKPLYDNFVNIRESLINEAIKNNTKLEITIPQGTAIHDPIIWKQTGKRVEQVFKFPETPMVMYGNRVNVKSKLAPAFKEKPQVIESPQASLFSL